MMEQSIASLNDMSSPTDQQHTRLDQGRLLRGISLGLIGVALIAYMLMILLWAVGHAPQSLLLFAGIVVGAACVIALLTIVLVQRRQLMLGARFFLYAFTLLAMLATFLIGGSRGPAAIFFVFPVVAAGLLGVANDSLRLAALATVGYLVVAIPEHLHLISPMLAFGLVPGSAFVIIFLGVLTLLSLVTWQSSKSLSGAMSRVQEQAEALLLSNEKLMEKNIQQVELGSEISAAASQMQLASQQQASGAAEQASAVSEVSTTIEELGSTARQIALSSEQVANAAQRTLENLSSGQGAVDESIQAMERIRGRMQDVSTRVLSLGERSQQIGEIIDLIDDISDETHLLALNAAIEAAGAGEHGRRFAVVAAEVKSLANRALVAAKEVRGVIAEMRQATNASVLAAEEGGKEVERGVELAHRAGQVMDVIVMMAERTAQSAAEISLATAQQQSASEQVVETMRDIADVTRQAAAGSRQAADSAAMLTAVAGRLHGITQRER